MSIKQQIKKLAKRNANEVINIRRHIHSYPELSYEEYNTAKYVASQLKAIGLQPTEGVAKTGLTALIEGKNPTKKVLALRADMDALPIIEANDVDYKSKNEGVMHACGHDAHTASLLGAAKILNELKDQFEGSVKLIFQPGEEKNPGGASLMIKEGVLKNPAPQCIFGQHVMPLIPAGKVGFKPGMYMASCDEIYLTVKGKGGHGAIPELTIDPVLITSHIIVALQQIISRNASPKTPTVLSFGKVIANGATNIIPEEVYVAGTFRAMNEEWRAEALKRIKKMAEGIAASMGGMCEVDISKGYPFLENDPALTGKTRSAAEAYVGKENVVDLDVWMGAEDFAYYTHEIPACFYRLGTRNEAKGITSYVHTPTFNIDEEALEIGAGMMAWIAVNELNR
ncbi:N-acetyl-L,L-diaminopimelate deacetylase [Fulvivirga imtechensis AK7]|uniref:N-acetyl-L,L-diaminopimelate deacetylase n=1 Tax=Fulvivirga imtechensis AK7 TaxID=1237149 RepID=L8JLW2_9BACT|nr:M20 family metallopeptidase [Fulvivirga imtechensis]ELR69921.1 N-acetyl-L,L-diaminopimelate deacetylase [Fulvivirga imtechensis AK7]